MSRSRRASWRGPFVAAFLVVVVGCVTPRGSRGGFQTDHFKFYEAQIVDLLSFAPVGLELKGQFEDGKKALPHEARLPTRFGNAVDKNGEGRIDRFAHLTWYPLAPTSEPLRKVSANNQFGTVTLTLGDPVAILVPTEKIEDGSRPAKNLSHFKVYQVLKVDGFQPRTVTLMDQYDEEPVETKIRRPEFFAVPVDKKVTSGGRDDTTPRRNRADHLVIYPIGPFAQNVEQQILNQFDTRKRTLQIDRAILLAVPSLKSIVR